LQKAREQKEKQRQALNEFLDGEEVQQVFGRYSKSLTQMFENYCKFDKQVTGKLSQQSYIQMGNKQFITPQLLST